MWETRERVSIIREMLIEYFPIESEMVGTSNLSNIANGISKEIRSSGGANFDIAQPISILVMSVGFINVVINICNAFRKENKPIPAAPELKINVESYVTVTNEISNDTKLNICQYVIDRIITEVSNDSTSE